MTFGGDITWLTDFVFQPQLKVSAEALVPKGWNADQSKQAVTIHTRIKEAPQQGLMPWTIEAIEGLLKELAEQHGWKLRRSTPTRSNYHAATHHHCSTASTTSASSQVAPTGCGCGGVALGD